MKKPNVSNFSDSKGVLIIYYYETNHSKTLWLKTPISFIISCGCRSWRGSARHFSLRVSHVVPVWMWPGWESSHLCVWCLSGKDSNSWSSWEVPLCLCVVSQHGSFREAGLLRVLPQGFKVRFPRELHRGCTGVPGRYCGFGSRHHNKTNISVKWVTWIFWFPSAYKSYVYTIL